MGELFQILECSFLMFLQWLQLKRSHTTDADTIGFHNVLIEDNRAHRFLKENNAFSRGSSLQSWDISLEEFREKDSLLKS